MKAALVLSMCSVLALPACWRAEGRSPGECADALDNDGDGLYDCDDQDCAGAPDCEVPHDTTPDTSYETFVEDLVRALCDKFLECDLFTEYFTYEDCLGTADAEDTGEPWECADFDGEAARECVEEWQAISCADLMDGDTPDSCDEVCSNY